MIQLRAHRVKQVQAEPLQPAPMPMATALRTNDVNLTIKSEITRASYQTLEQRRVNWIGPNLLQLIDNFFDLAIELKRQLVREIYR
jgi:hypothetical protein